MRRVLGFADLFVIAAASIGPAFSLATTFGAMVGAGGSGTPLALLLVTAVMACVAAAYRRLGERYPNAGSSYSWVRVAFGPVAGAYAAWVLIVANVFAVVATAVPAGTYTLALIAPVLADRPLADALAGTVWVCAAGALLYAGLRPTARVTSALLVAELLVLALVAGAALLQPVAEHAAARAAAPPASGLIAALVIGIWMIDGWEVSASAAEESADAARAPGAGGLAGLLLSAAVLWLCMTAFLRVGTLDGFAAHEGDAMAYVGAALGGNAWRVALSVTVLVSLAASLQTTLIYLTRSFFAMGRDGVLPDALGALDRRAQPARAIVVMTALGMGFTLASGLSPTLKDAFAFILSGTSVFLGLLFALSAAAAVRVFARDRAALLDGVVLPGVATAVLLAVLGASVVGDDPGIRAFIGIAAGAGLPLAWWRGRASAAAI
ncbi:MAG: APC family permease [Candidatus Velthaea sp.]